MSTIATSGACSRTAASRASASPDLGDDVEARLGQQPRDPLPQEERVVGQDEPEGHAPFTSARIAAPDSSSFGMNPRAAAALEARPVGARLAARRQDDEGRRPVHGQFAGDVEALDVGQADVEQDEIRADRPGSGEARGAVVRLADDGEAVGLEEGARLDAEAGVVIDDEDGVHGGHRGRTKPPLLQG